MLTRIIGFIVCVLIMAFSMVFINLDTFNGYLVGVPMFLAGFIIGVLIICSNMEQIVNNLKGDLIENELSLSHRDGRPYLDPMSSDYIQKLNTPDLNLIHPDDVNGQRRPAPVVYSSHYAKQQADYARLDIKV